VGPLFCTGCVLVGTNDGAIDKWFVSFMIASWNGDGEEGLAWIAAARAADHRIALAEAYNGNTFFLTGSDEALAAFTRRLAETAPTA
jgi:hypothetical protein